MLLSVSFIPFVAKILINLILYLIGDYGNTQIYMGSNSLERFESAVFLTVLKQMEPLEKTGFIHVDNSKRKA